jgi:hypothetical protein
MKNWAVIAALLPSLAQAEWNDQLAGLWLNPDNPGWGVSVQQQGDHAIATVLTYGNNGQAKWYQARDLRLPAWNPHIMDGPVTVSGELLEGGASRSVGSIVLTFNNGYRDSLTYTIDAVPATYTISKFVFGGASLDGSFTGVQKLTSVGTYPGICLDADHTSAVRLTASTSADNTVRLVMTSDDGATCTAQGVYYPADASPSINGRVQCTGVDGISDTDFSAGDVRIARDTVSFNLFMTEHLCSYYGPMVFARTDALLDDAAAPHDDVSGLWTTERGWSVTAHLQGSKLFAMVLAADGSWSVAPDAAYMRGKAGEAVTYGGALWTMGKSPYVYSYDDLDSWGVGSMELTVDPAGDSTARFGVTGLPTGVSRVTWPRDQSIAGSYFGVRTNVAPSSPTSIVETFAINDVSATTYIALREGDSYCELKGALEWQGSVGRMNGTAACTDANGSRSSAFQADNIRITDEGVTMRYSFDGASGSIAGVKN